MSLFARPPRSDPTTTESLAELQGRAHRAQQALWHREWPRLYPIALKILRSESEAEGLVADALTDFLFHHVDQLQSARAVPAYLRIMVIRRATRRRDQAWRHDDLDEIAPLPDPADGADEAVDRRSWLTWLDHCLAQLKGRARQLLKLHFGHDLSYAQIGAQLEISKQAVGKAVQQSERALRRCIDQQRQQQRAARSAEQG